MQISARTSRSGRSRGSSTANGLEGASHCFRRFTRAGPFLLDAFPESVKWTGVQPVALRLGVIVFVHSKSSISSASSSFSSWSSLLVFRKKSVMTGAKKNAV